MLDALHLVAQIRSDLKPLETRITDHAYLKALEENRVHRDSLKVFVGQQHHIISSDLRSIALILSRQGMLPSRRFLINVLQGEAAALEALHTFTVDPAKIEANYVNGVLTIELPKRVEAKPKQIKVNVSKTLKAA